MPKCERHRIDIRWCGTCNPQLLEERNPKKPSSGRGPNKKRFQQQQTFMRNLPPELQEHFDEMLALDVIVAHMAVDLFGLNGQKKLTQKMIAEKFGYSRSYVSTMVSAMVLYFDPEQPAAKKGHQAIETIKNIVIKKRRNRDRA